MEARICHDDEANIKIIVHKNCDSNEMNTKIVAFYLNIFHRYLSRVDTRP